MTVLLPPASACATASTMALRRARLSSTAAYWMGSATADMKDSRQKDSPFTGVRRISPLPPAQGWVAHLPLTALDRSVSKRQAPGWRITASRASSSERAPIWPSEERNSSI